MQTHEDQRKGKKEGLQGRKKWFCLIKQASRKKDYISIPVKGLFVSFALF